MVTMLFGDMSESLVARSLAILREKIMREREAAYEAFENWYLGGDAVSRYLIKNEGESTASYQARVSRLAHFNYVGRIVDEIVDDAYGDLVERRFGGTATPDQEKLLQEQFEWNVFHDVQQELCRSQVLYGDGWLNVAYQPDDNKIALYPVHPADIWYRTDPNNPNRIVELVERRAIDDTNVLRGTTGSVYQYWYWSNEWMALIDSRGVYLTIPGATQRGPIVNPYGAIPYVRWKGRSVVGELDGISYVRDLVLVQRLLLNRVSDVDKLIRYQTHGLLVIKGIEEATIRSGADSFIRLTNPDDNAFFINPNADIAAASATIGELKDLMFEISSVPKSLVTGGSANSGLQLAIEMRPLTRVVEAVRTKAAVSERGMMRMIARIGYIHKMGFPADDANISPHATFSANFLPSDKTEEFNRDLLMLNNEPPLMTVDTFIRRWHPDLRGDDDAIAEYIAELRKQAMGSTTYTSRATTGGTTPPPDPPSGGDDGGGVEPPGGPPKGGYEAAGGGEGP